MLIFVFNQDKLYAQGQGQGGPPIWRLDGNSVSDGDFLGTTNDMPLVFKINTTETMRLLPGGNVGIATSSPEHKLDFCGKIRSSVEVMVNQEDWCAYAFEPDYNATSWKEKEEFYIENKHLPGIKSASHIMEEGLELGQTVKGIMLNDEENRLDITQLYKIIEELKQENKEFRKIIEKQNNYEKNLIDIGFFFCKRFNSFFTGEGQFV